MKKTILAVALLMTASGAQAQTATNCHSFGQQINCYSMPMGPTARAPSFGEQFSNGFGGGFRLGMAIKRAMRERQLMEAQTKLIEAQTELVQQQLDAQKHAGSATKDGEAASHTPRRHKTP